MERYKLSLNGREKISLLLVGLVVIFLAGGLFNLQVIKHERLAEQSENNFIRVVPIVPKRGLILDRNGKVIVDNRPSYALSVIVAEMVEGVTLPNLAELIGMDTSRIQKRIKRNLVSRYQPAEIVKDIPFEVVAMLEEQRDRFPGVSYQMERVRRYTEGFGTEVYTGYVGEISPEELKNKDQLDLRPGSMIGKKGLEKELDFLLRGIEGSDYIEVFASGQIRGPYDGRKGIAAIAGADITLSIDLDLQEYCSTALDTFCCGALVAMVPSTGEILAMTSHPGYDPNIFSTVIPESLWTDISTDSRHPLLNRVLSGLYPPGSTTKLITVGTALEERLITPGTKFDPCLGGFKFGDRVFHCWNHGGHGKLNAAHALEESCDIYMYQVGLKIGIDLLSEYYGKCGFGYSTGIQLPGEASGLNPNSEYYDQRYGKNKWTKGLVLNNSIGQGEILATPLQLAQFFCGIANNGTVYRPSLVKMMTTHKGDTIYTKPTRSFDLPFSQPTLDVLKEGLRLVVEGKKGTARSLANDYYTLGGKTGTAQNPHGENHSLFVAYAPLDKPEIVACVVVDNGGNGSDVAAPIAGRLIEKYMRKRLKLPDSLRIKTGRDR